MCLSGLFLLVGIKVIAVQRGLKRTQITNNKSFLFVDIYSVLFVFGRA